MRRTSIPSWSVASTSLLTFISSIELPLDMFFTVVSEYPSFAFDPGPQMHRTTPDRIDILQRIFRVIDPKIDTLMPMIEQQFPAIFEVAVGNVDKWLSKIGERKQQLLFDALPVPIGNFINAAFRIELVREEPALVTELFREERVDERDVIVDAPRFENLLAAQAKSGVPLAFRDVVVTLVVILAELSLIPAKVVTLVVILAELSLIPAILNVL